MTLPLDNIFWQAMSGPQARFAAGTSRARRYAAGFSPIVAFADPAQPAFADLVPHCDAGEHLYVEGWSGVAPAGWRVEFESTMLRMVWDAQLPALNDVPDVAEAVSLGPQHVAQAVELAALTRPGPFGPRTLELGDYLGCFDGGQLVAMAGERAFAGRWREVSGVCTHPEQRGRGLARRLMTMLLRRQLQRGETPFLHVMSSNTGARGLYRQMGFRDDRECAIRIVVRD